MIIGTLRVRLLLREARTLKVADRTHISIIVNMANATDPTTQAVLQFIARHSELRLTPKQEKKAGDTQ